MPTPTIPSTMLNFFIQLSLLDENGAVQMGSGNSIILDCTTKNLFGFTAPDIEELAIDNPEYGFKARFVGKSGIEPANLTCVYDAVAYEQLTEWKKIYPAQRFQASATCKEIGKVQVTKPVIIGQLGGVTGNNAGTYTMTLEPLGGKTHSSTGTPLTNSPLPTWETTS